MCCRSCSNEGVVCATAGHGVFRQRQDKILIELTIHAKEWFDETRSKKVSYDFRPTTMRRR
jgi:hypothetical protein